MAVSASNRRLLGVLVNLDGVGAAHGGGVE